MTRELHRPEKRQFGRRTVLWHAWIKVAGRDREACIVRNFSVTGALLEFASETPAADRFQLAIDHFNFTAECYVRHRSRTGVGVYFSDTVLNGQAINGIAPAEVVARIQAERELRRRGPGPART